MKQEPLKNTPTYNLRQGVRTGRTWTEQAVAAKPKHAAQVVRGLAESLDSTCNVIDILTDRNKKLRCTVWALAALCVVVSALHFV